MDGRNLRCCLLWGFVTVLTGCTPGGTMLRPAETPPAAGAEEPEVIAHQAPTWVAYANMRAGVGFSKDHNPQQQQTAREEARLGYLKALEVDPKHLPAYLGLARLQQACEDHNGAMATFDKALRLAPRDASLWHEVGMCQCRQKRWQEGAASFQKACELNPSNKAYQVTLGYTLGRAGMIKDSLAVLEKVLGEARANYDLARLMRHMSQPELARQLATVAVAKDPKLPGVREFLAELENRPPPEPLQTVAYNAPAQPAAAPPGLMPAVTHSVLPAATPPAPAPAPRRTTEVVNAAALVPIDSGAGAPMPNIITPAMYGATVSANQGATPAGRLIRMPPLPVINPR